MPPPKRSEKTVEVTLRKLGATLTLFVALISGVNYITATLIAPGIIDAAHEKAKTLVKERLSLHDSFKSKELDLVYRRLGEIQADFTTRLDRLEAKLDR